MALSNAQLDLLRQTFRRNFSRPDLTKTQINAAFAAIESRLTGNANVGAQSVKAVIGADIEAAAPSAFSAGEKQLLFGCWCDGAANRLGVV